ncbi:hypothetical protein RB653_003918 [Dictyostelium firmibasis]|uniref:SHSP domain-containing protein n=1 Tax=Dictyostelium firmibasis TaxID=79012 RepID=A0AAN7Z2X4_9MYCE
MSSSIFNLLFNNNECNKYNLIKQSIEKNKNRKKNKKQNVFPPIEINESIDNYIILVELPGIPIDQIKISMKNYIITLQVNKTIGNNHLNEKYKNLFCDREFGVFIRSINFQQVKDKISKNSITSNFSNGLLTLKLNKKIFPPLEK